MIALIKLFVWNDPLQVNEVFSSVKLFLVLSGIYFVVQCVYETFGDYLKGVLLSEWAVNHKIDFGSTISTSLKKNFDALSLEEAEEELHATKLCIRSALYSKDFITRSKIKVLSIVRICLAAVAVIFAYFFCVNNVEVYMQAELWKSEILNTGGFEFSMMKDWWLLISAVIIGATYFFFEFYIDAVEEKAIKTWFTKNLPDRMADYEKYAKAVERYFAEREDR